MERFEAFKKKIDQDPFDALFGKSSKWLGWTLDSTANGNTDLDGQTSVLKKRAADYLGKDQARNAMKETSDTGINDRPATGDNQYRSQDHLVKEKFEEQGYEIDPITLRKIPKNRNPNAASKSSAIKTRQESFDIPVKAFRPTPPSSAIPAKGNTSTQVDDWLSREDFGCPKDTQKPMSADEYGTFLTPKTSASKIESALDRHVREKDANTGKSYSTPTYEANDTIDEDIESLRASDVRASVGKGSQQTKTNDLSLDARRQTLEDRDERLQPTLGEKRKRNESDYERLEHLNKKTGLASSTDADREPKALKEINKSSVNESSSIVSPTVKLSSPSTASPSNVAKAQKLSSFSNEKTLNIQSKIVPLKAQLDSMKVEYDALRQAWLAETRRLKAKRTKELHEQEVKAQKAAMEAAEVHRGEGDMAPNVHQFAVKRTAAPVEADEASKTLCGGEGDMAPNVAQYASRDRWYKRKAPHAQCEMDAKMQQLANDKALVREVRGIYEDTYGIIDTKHRQEQLRGEGDMSPSVAQFASRDRRYERKPSFPTDGVVVPKKETGIGKSYKMLKEDPSAELLTKDVANSSTSTSIPKTDQEPIQTQHSPVAPTNAATAHQIADLKAQLDKQAAELQAHRDEIQSLRASNATTTQPASENKAASVRRMEPVFSGRRNKEKKRASRRRKTFRHILLTGAITAACCYATGVAVELMKVNGL